MPQSAEWSHGNFLAILLLMDWEGMNSVLNFVASNHDHVSFQHSAELDCHFSPLDLGLPLVDPSGGFDVVEPDGLLVVVPEELDDGVLDAVIVLLDVADDP